MCVMVRCVWGGGRVWQCTDACDYVVVVGTSGCV